MGVKKVVVIGAGHRVCDAVLPAIESRRGEWDLVGVFSRSSKIVQAGNREFQVQPLANLGADALEGVELIYCGVSIAAVPQVLQQIQNIIRDHVDLLIDTPVLLVKDIRFYKHFGVFRKVWVSEDVWTLPWIETIAAARDHYELGMPAELMLDRSGYSYHGIALAKTLLEDRRIRSTRTIHSESKSDTSEKCYGIRLAFASGRTCTIQGPRDYMNGSFTLDFENGRISDCPANNTHHLEGVVEGQRWVGFRIGEVSSYLLNHEVDLFGPISSDQARAGVIFHMHNCKRVGLARLLDRIASGQGAYPLVEGVDDMWVDYMTKVLGRWYETPLTSARSGLSRSLVGGLWSTLRLIRG